MKEKEFIELTGELPEDVLGGDWEAQLDTLTEIEAVEIQKYGISATGKGMETYQLNN